MIERGEVYFSKPSELNDPFEFCWMERWPKNPVKVDNFLTELLATQFPHDTIEERRFRYQQMKREARGFTAKARQNQGYTMRTATVTLGVLSVSEDWSHPLMWSHYADHHRGIAVGIDPTAITGKIFHPVNYIDEVAKIHVYDYLRPSVDRFLDLSLRKSDIWSYEREYRTANKAGSVCYSQCVKKVVVGLSASQNTVKEVRQSIKKSGYAIDLHVASMRSGSYSICTDPELPLPSQ
jgi:hypothetical protein